MEQQYHPYTTAIILAGGTGSRMSTDGLPKQLLTLSGEPVLAHTLRTFDQIAQVDYLVIVTKKDIINTVGTLCQTHICQTPYCITVGGATRQDSAKAGVAEVPPLTKFVALHDAARCLVHPRDVVAVFERAYETGAATLASAMTDTIKTITPDYHIQATIKRETVVAVQTPQVFLLEKYRTALKQAEMSSIAFTDDNQMMELLGESISVVLSNHPNPKLTYPHDLQYAEYLMKKQQKQEKGEGTPMMRIGHGYDVHALVQERKCIIGGIDIPYEKGLKGHSDADVLLHAIMDALLGAAGLADIGQYFPDTDPQYSDANSLVLLEKVGEIIKEAGYRIVNIDSTVIAQAPKLAPYIAMMKQKIATALHCSENVVNVKATTEEKLGFTGAGQGIASHAVCLLQSI